MDANIVNDSRYSNAISSNSVIALNIARRFNGIPVGGYVDVLTQHRRIEAIYHVPVVPVKCLLFSVGFEFDGTAANWLDQLTRSLPDPIERPKHNGYKYVYFHV